MSYRSVQSTNKQLHVKSQSPPLYTVLFFWPRSYTAAVVRKPTKTVPLRVSSGHYHLCLLKMFCSECEHIEAKKNSACFRNFESWKDLGMYKQRNSTFESLLLERMWDSPWTLLIEAISVPNCEASSVPILTLPQMRRKHWATHSRCHRVLFWGNAYP